VQASGPCILIDQQVSTKKGNTDNDLNEEEDGVNYKQRDDAGLTLHLGQPCEPEEGGEVKMGTTGLVASCVLPVNKRTWTTRCENDVWQLLLVVWRRVNEQPLQAKSQLSFLSSR
jgi:hypothetical protein